jgi:hypothetical protein
MYIVNFNLGLIFRFLFKYTALFLNDLGRRFRSFVLPGWQRYGTIP